MLGFVRTFLGVLAKPILASAYNRKIPVKSATKQASDRQTPQQSLRKADAVHEKRQNGKFVHVAVE